ncbi:MAG TPA: hypothetical protein VH599_11935 [Ktedonobacterales bacterium]
MKSYRRRASFRAAAAAWPALPGQLALAALIALALLAFGAIAVPDGARAADGGPQIKFTAPIYAGQNNGFAEGPVGTNVSVQGSGWTAGGGDVTMTLADEGHDTSGQPGSACQNGSPTVSIPNLGPQPLGTAGNPSDGFTAIFEWPAGAGAKGHSYWACGTQGGTTAPGVDKFTVLSANRPAVKITVSQAFPGSTITVTGQNWLPGGIQVGVIIAPCVACDSQIISGVTVNSNANGSFSAAAQVPPAAPIGSTLFVSAQSIDQANPNNSGALSTGTSMSTRFTVVAQPTPTPTPTSTPTPTATPTSTAPGTANGEGNGGNTNGSSSDTVLVVLLAALGVVLLIAAVVAVLLFLRSRRPAAGAAGAGGPPYGSPPYGPPGGEYGRYSGPRRARGPRSGPSYADTNADYYDEPPARPPGRGNAGGWQGNPQEWESDGEGDEPTIGMPKPWR